MSGSREAAGERGAVEVTEMLRHTTAAGTAAESGKCDACGLGDDVEQVGAAELCDRCSARVDEDLRDLLAWVDWLPPAARGDLLASEVGPATRRERAADRGVHSATVSRNVAQARDRLATIAEQEGDR